MGTAVRSFAKINLGLRIGTVREDGYHALETMYQTVGLADVVTVSARRAAETRIVIRTEDRRVPVDGRNTAWAMVERVLRAAGVAAEVAIEIDKRLPVQGGLGAGSANAAAALLGLERELGVEVDGAGWLAREERMAVAAAVGSDVPLFLVGGSVLGEGRGELVRELPDVCGGLACVVAVPRVGVSTPMAFGRWDGWAAKRRGLTTSPVPDTLDELSRVYSAVFGSDMGETAPGSSGISKRSLALDGVSADFRDGSGAEAEQADQATRVIESLVRAGIENDFEEVVFSFHPSLREIKRHLVGDPGDGGALYAALSGSGSALFGLYRSEAEAEAAQRRLQGTGTNALRTRTLSRKQYWQSIFPEEKTDAGAAERVD